MHRQRFEICECSTGFGVKTRSKIFATKNALHINLNSKLVKPRLNINWTIVVTRRRVTSACISSERGSVFKAPQKTSVFRLVVQVPLVSFTFNSDNLWTHHAMIFRVKQKFFIRREGKSADSFIRELFFVHSRSSHSIRLSLRSALIEKLPDVGQPVFTTRIDKKVLPSRGITTDGMT